jgi:hypothetical protein
VFEKAPVDTALASSSSKLDAVSRAQLGNFLHKLERPDGQIQADLDANPKMTMVQFFKAHTTVLDVSPRDNESESAETKGAHSTIFLEDLETYKTHL